MSVSRETTVSVVLALAFAILGTPAAVSAEEHFHASVAAGSDYTTLVDFWTSLGASVGAQSIIRIVTDNTNVADLSFRIEPEETSSAEPLNTRAPVTFGVGAAEFEDLVETPITTQIVAPTIKACVVDPTADPLLCLDAVDPSNSPAAPGFLMVDVTVEYSGTYDFQPDPDPGDQVPGMGEKWTLKVEQIASGPKEYFGFAGATIAEVTRDKIDVADSMDFGAVQLYVRSDLGPVMAVDVQNVGTAPTGVTPLLKGLDPSVPIPDFRMETNNVPGPLLPGETLRNVFDEDPSDGTVEEVGLWVMAQPQKLARRTAILELSSANDSAEIPLEAWGINLYAHLLIDCSPSMGKTLTAEEATVEDDTRLFKAKDAAEEVINWIKEFSSEQAYIGLVRFPQSQGEGDGELMVDIDQANNSHPKIQGHLGRATGNGLTVGSSGTPMEAGIIVARTDMNTRIDDRTNLEQAIVLLTDGEETTGSAENQIDDLKSDGISMYTVGYGTAGDEGWGFDHVLLGKLAGDTGGQFWDASAPTPFSLKDAFKAAMTPLLGLRVVKDPKGTIRRGQTKTHPVCVEGDAYGLTFSVDWGGTVPNALDATLRTPTNQPINPNSADISYYEGDTFIQYIIQGPRVRGGQAAGEWTVIINGSDAIPSDRDTEYSYNALVQSPIDVQPRFELLQLGPEQIFEMEVFGWGPDPVIGAEATLKFDAPAESRGTFLATHDIDPAWIFGKERFQSSHGDNVRRRAMTTRSSAARPESLWVPDTLMGEPATITQKKLYALANFADTPFTNMRETGSVTLRDDGKRGDKEAGDGVFTAHMPELVYDGMYSFLVDFSALTPVRRECVSREIRFDRVLDVALVAELIPDNVEWKTAEADLFFDPNVWKRIESKPPRDDHVRTAVIFEATDGVNHWGPGRARDVQFEVEGGTPIGGTIDNWDGTYLQVIEHRRGTRPGVVIQAAGITSPPIYKGGGAGGCAPWSMFLRVLAKIGSIFGIGN